MRYRTFPQKKASNNSIIFPIKKSTLCNNKEFFYTKNSENKISKEEYRDALNYIENMDTVYFSMDTNEKRLYNQNLTIVKEYYSQIK
ncbi:MAG: hypothetical protein IJ638_03610 [Alphaproteobacteria bacterium]|nr:hypothetical protein [Alphaproteobacteria bacterium]